ncbi:MAG: thiol peroxidase [Flavobacteriales bacterium]|nr:thiol peroxidase [Flavobacteriales bacterium]
MPLPALNGTLPAIGQPAPELRFVGVDRGNDDLMSLRGQVVILLAFPSLDTGVCAVETRKFNQLAVGLGATILVVSVDTPFAMKRFCIAEGIENVRMGSDFRFHDLFRNWGVGILEGPLEGATARAVWVLDRDGVVRYVELVPEIGNEPDYDAALKATRNLIEA